MKKCAKCGKDRSLSKFFKDRKAPDGLMYWCVYCCSDNQILQRKNKKEKIKLMMGC